LIAIKFLLDKLQASCNHMSLLGIKPDPEDPVYEWLQKLTSHIQATINDLDALFYHGYSSLFLQNSLMRFH
jgi:hypothetical protein